MIEKNDIEKLIEDLRAPGIENVIDNALRHAGFIARVAPRLPDHCFLQPGIQTAGLPSVVLAWESADEDLDEGGGEDEETDENEREKRPGCVVSFDLSPKRAGFWSQRKLQRMTIDKNLWMFADETAIRTDDFGRDEQLIRIGFGWLDAAPAAAAAPEA